MDSNVAGWANLALALSNSATVEDAAVEPCADC
jgi:hypothetical protein